MNINILEVSELNWKGRDESNSDDHYIYNCGQESLKRNVVALMVNKRVQNVVLGCNLKNNNDLGSFPKQTIQHVIQVYDPTTDAKEAEADCFYEDLQDLELTLKKKKNPFHHRGLECKDQKSRDTSSNRQVWPWSTK